MEKRNYEIRAADKPLTLEGVAVVFGKPAQIGGVTEVISPEALRGVDLSDGIAKHMQECGEADGCSLHLIAVLPADREYR